MEFASPAGFWLGLAAAGVLAAHPDPSNPFENPCVHTAEYGTRSSSLLAVAAGERRWRFRHAEGPPCEAKYANLTRLLDEIRPGSAPAGAPRSFHAHEDDK